MNFLINETNDNVYSRRSVSVSHTFALLTSVFGASQLTCNEIWVLILFRFFLVLCSCSHLINECDKCQNKALHAFIVVNKMWKIRFNVADECKTRRRDEHQPKQLQQYDGIVCLFRPMLSRVNEFSFAFLVILINWLGTNHNISAWRRTHEIMECLCCDGPSTALANRSEWK